MTIQQTQSAALWVGQKMQLMVEASEDLKALLHGSLLRVLTNLLLMTPTKSKWGWYVDWEISFFTHDVKHIFVFLGECFCGWTKRGESLLLRWYEEERKKRGRCRFMQICMHILSTLFNTLYLLCYSKRNSALKNLSFPTGSWSWCPSSLPSDASTWRSKGAK